MNENVKASVALGFFDGLHLGHAAVLDSALSQAKNGYKPVVLLFDRHPRQVLTGENVGFLLAGSERDEILAKLGFETVTVSFERIMNMTPERFFDDILLKELNAGFVSCGFNYTFGIGGSGNTSVLKTLCDKKSIGCTIVPEILSDGVAVSSSLIRACLKNGDIETANKMLGRNFGFTAEVFHGDKRGRLLGSPTINQYLPEGLTVPRFGVYAARVLINGEYHTGVANIGNRPTFDGVSVRSETFILGYEGNLYGETLRTELLSFVRPEIKFSSSEELIARISADTEFVRKKFGGNE